MDVAVAVLVLLTESFVRYHHRVICSEGSGDCGRHHRHPAGDGQPQQADGPGRVAFGDQFGCRVSVLLGALLETCGCAAEVGVVEQGQVVDGHEDVAHTHAGRPPLLRHKQRINSSVAVGS